VFPKVLEASLPARLHTYGLGVIEWSRTLDGLFVFLRRKAIADPQGHLSNASITKGLRKTALQLHHITLNGLMAIITPNKTDQHSPSHTQLIHSM
jgi:hypothetical protein